jgi:phenylalanine-4-hydroxylase
MAIGENIVSAFSGTADADSFGLNYEPPKERTHQIVYDQKTVKLHKLYENVRDIRQMTMSIDKLPEIWDQLLTSYPEEWLLPTEIYELTKSVRNLTSLSNDIKQFLLKERISNTESASIINSIIE